MSDIQSIGRARLILVSGFGWMFDAMDILMLSYILAYLGNQLGWGGVERSIVILANNLGLLIGATLFGYLADIIGRKKVFMITLGMYSVLAAFQGFIRDHVDLAIVRFFMGLGLGGELPVASTMVSELSRPEERGRNVILLESFWAYGTILAAAISAFLMPRIGYTNTMLLLSLTALYIVVLRRSIPEPIIERASRSRVAIADLITTSRRVTLISWTAWFSIAFGYYGAFLWLPQILVSKGFGVIRSLEYTFYMALAQIPGYFSAAYMVERLGRRPTFIAYMVASAVSAYLLAISTSHIDILLWGSLLNFFNLGAWGVIYAYTPELFKAPYRATGTGSSGSLARVGMIIGPLVPTATGSFETSLAIFGLVWVIGSLSVLGAPETKLRVKPVASQRL
ncbi:MAG TPA: MFS transporter [Sulfolobales archaeon]|nr:MFS transporter [Sulfolobales archaeon]